MTKFFLQIFIFKYEFTQKSRVYDYTFDSHEIQYVHTIYINIYHTYS